jgi:ATP-dependent DNA ligase
MPWHRVPRWDGFRALVSVDADRVLLRSGRGTQLLPAFSEVAAGVRAAAGRQRA